MLPMRVLWPQHGFPVPEWKVPGKPISVVDDDVGLKLEDHVIHFLCFPLLGAERPVHVVPENVDSCRSSSSVRESGRACRLQSAAAPPRPWRTGRHPDDASPSRSNRNQRATPRPAQPRHIHAPDRDPGLFGSAIVGELGVEMAETFMVLGRHHHVFLASLLGKPRPCRAAFGIGLKCLARSSYSGTGMPSFSITHSWRPTGCRVPSG